MNSNDFTLRNIGLQFFAEDGNGGNGGAPGNEGGTNENKPGNDGTNPNGGNPKQEPAGKSYTQEQINSMMANEKRTARQALLKELGFDIKDDKSFTDTMANIKKTLDAGKTQQQLDAEARKKAEDAQKTAEGRATQLEMKVAALSAGVNPEFLDDVITLASAKVNDSITIDKVITEMKTKYPSFFKESESKPGTGSPANPAKKGGNNESLGQRLAKQHKANPGKSSYFKN